MSRYVRLRELLVGIEGLALHRHLYDATDEDAERRLSEIRRVLEDDASAAGDPIRELTPHEGYEAWSTAYDDPGNPIVALEQPAVWSVVDQLTPGSALDAGCGTGRHARRLVDLGYQVLGVDLAPQMLARAAASIPKARFIAGDLRAIPAAGESFELVVCGLALAHLADLRFGIDELARVLKPAGHLVVSVLNPVMAHLGWHARFTDPTGRRAFIREHAHTHADYIAAFRAANLNICDCVEPTLTSDHLPALRRVFGQIPEATERAYSGLPAVLVWLTQKQAAGAR